MTPEQTHLWLEIQHRQMVALERIADSIQHLVPVSTAAPNYQQPLESFAQFDWSTIGAVAFFFAEPQKKVLINTLLEI